MYSELKPFKRGRTSFALPVFPSGPIPATALAYSSGSCPSYATIHGIGPTSVPTRRVRLSMLGTARGTTAVESGEEEDTGNEVITQADLD